MTLALRAGEEQETDPSISLPESTEETMQTPQPDEEPVNTTMERNTDGDLYSLIATYYNALALGDVETIKSISSYMEDTEEIRIPEMAKYVESYPLIEIYTKPGPRENSLLAYVYTHMTVVGFEEEVPAMKTFYVCTREDGTLYLNTSCNGSDQYHRKDKLTVSHRKIQDCFPSIFYHIPYLSVKNKRARNAGLSYQLWSLRKCHINNQGDVKCVRQESNLH